MNSKAVIKHIVDWIIQYSQNSKTNGFVVGISGGIDSAVTSSLMALTSKPVICLDMPIYQNKNEITRAVEHIEQLKKRFSNVSSNKINLTSVYDNFKSILPQIENNNQKNQIAFVNSRARLRMTTLYYFAGLHNMLVVGTGNKIEDFGIGFFTKYGDGGVDISPIADLMKSQVFLLGKELGVSESILQATPTDGLWEDNRTDREQIGASYDELEWAMNLPQNADHKGFTNRQKEVFEIYNRLNTINRHKMEPIPICKIPKELKNTIC